jgi:heat shock protein 5
VYPWSILILYQRGDFKDTQRQAVKDAGAHAGLTILRVINEPTAAACAYSLDKEAGEQHVLVYDLGGSTLDVSLLLLDDGVFEVLATAGDSHLGGTSFDDRMVDFFMKGHRMKTSIDVSWDFSALERLKRQVEEAKWALSIQQSTQIDTGPLQGGHRLQETITRTEFEELNIDLFLKTLRSVDQVLAEGNLKREEVDKVRVVVG